MKTYYADYFRKSFIPFLVKKYWTGILLLFFMSIVYISSISYHKPDSERRLFRKSNLFVDAAKGLPYYGPAEFGYSCMVFALALGASLIGVNYNYVRVKMIVGVEINEDKKTITLFTRNLLRKLNRTTYRYNQIKMRNGKDKHADGLDFLSDVRCGIFSHNRIIIGRFYIDHFTWPENEGLLKDIIHTVQGTHENSLA
jgi:hypothetical protein